jgi:hypothetical protein
MRFARVGLLGVIALLVGAVVTVGVGSVGVRAVGVGSVSAAVMGFLVIGAVGGKGVMGFVFSWPRVHQPA